ncbi:MAG: hypothetical protein SVR94_12485 [Pseudomonadota bacterium]|nr:hypothetical protein [Pseudomonadota bacterium]
MMNELFYYVVSDVKYGGTLNPKLSDGVQGTVAAVKLIRSSIKPFGGWPNSTRTKTELEKLVPKINQKMPESGGVVVCLGIEEIKK